MAGFGFSLDEYEDSGERGSFEPMPKGEYKLKATEAEAKKTAKGGAGINVTFEVAAGEFTGRKVWQWFNTICASEKAEKIGREQLSGWARAAGKPNARDTDELLERTFFAKLDIEKDATYGDKNKIVGFLTPGSEGKSAPAPTKKSSFEDVPAPKPEARAYTHSVEEKQPNVKNEPVTASPSEAPASSGKKKPWED